MSSSRARRTVVAAAFLSAGLALSGCGATVDQAGSSGGGAPAESCVDTSGPEVKIGFLNSRSGTMAISENTVYNSLKMAADQINAAGGVLGKQLTVVAEDGASEPTVFAEKAEKLIRERLRSRGVRRLDLVLAQGHAAGLRGQRRAAVLPGAVRGPGVVEEHLLHRRHHQPADRAGAGLPEGAGRQEPVPGGQRLRLPADRQQDHQGLRGGERDGDQGRGVRPAGLHRLRHDRGQGAATPTPTRCSTP